MVAVGVLYLLFEDRILGDRSSSVRVSLGRKQGLISRSLIGIQEGLLHCASRESLLTTATRSV